jgi:hypothetical protein
MQFYILAQGYKTKGIIIMREILSRRVGITSSSTGTRSSLALLLTLSVVTAPLVAAAQNIDELIQLQQTNATALAEKYSNTEPKSGGAGENSPNLALHLCPPALQHEAKCVNSTVVAQVTTTSEDIGEVTSVSQLSDVQTNDWAFEALKTLIERYGAIAGYPDGTFRGNQRMTRYEFATALNAILKQLNATGALKQEDMATLQKLQEQFAAELATLGSRIDTLEARTTHLEAQQFYPTTKLNGETIFAVSSLFGDNKANLNEDLADNSIFSHRVRLNVDTSFSGKDQLRTRLQARNTTPFSSSAISNTNMTRSGFDGNSNNQFEIGKLFYKFPIGTSTNVTVDAIGADYSDNIYTFNRWLESSGWGAIYRFGRYNPIYRQGDGGAGITITHKFNEKLTVNGGYLALNAQNPSSENGLFNGNYNLLAQLDYRPSDRFGLGLTYVHGYYPGKDVNLTGSTGSSNAQKPFGNVATSADHFGLEATAQLTPRLAISGWGGLTKADEENTNRDATVWNWSVNVAFPNLGKKGNLGGLVFGMPPKLTYIEGGSKDPGTSYHIEAFYRAQVTDNISITPGLLIILNPEHNSNNDTIYAGIIRTTFRF